MVGGATVPGPGCDAAGVRDVAGANRPAAGMARWQGGWRWGWREAFAATDDVFAER